MKTDSSFILYLHRFSIRTRLFSIVLAFAVPLSVLIYSTIDNINRNIILAEQEVKGVQYERLLIEILAALSNHRLLRISIAGGEDRAEEYAKQSSDIDRLLAELEIVDHKFGVDLRFIHKIMDNGGNELLSEQPISKILQGNWNDIKKYSNDKYEVYTTIFKNIGQMITNIGDASSLILDPDLDSYYLMDVSVNKLPNSIKRISDIAYKLYPSIVFGEKATQELRSEVKISGRFLKEVEFDSVISNIESALRQDKNFYGISATLLPTMQPIVIEYKKKIESVINMLNDAYIGKDISSKEFFTMICDVRKFFVKMNHVTLDELNVMLIARIDYYEQKKLETFIVYALAQLIGLGLFFFLTTSVTTPINRLYKTITSITNGNLDTVVPSSDFQDEIGAMARGVESFRLNSLEKLRLETALKEESDYLQSIMDSSGDGIIVINSKGRILDFNLAAEKIFGYSAVEIIGQYMSVIISQSFTGDYEGYMERHLSKENSSMVGVNREIEGKRKNGEIFPVEITLSKLIHEQETLFVGLLKDITERKILEHELRQHRDNLQKMVDIQTVDLIVEKEKAERATIAKSEFLSNMSHELRTPMHAILNYANMGIKIVGEDPDIKLSKYLINIRTAGNRLLALLNNLLDFEKLEAGKMGFNLKDGDFVKIVDYAVIELESLLKAKNLQLIKNYASKDTHISMDEPKLIQVMVNLISNAIKFSPENGIITVTVSDEYLLEKGLVRASLLCCVEDEGGGIPEDELETIFEKFTQSSKTKRSMLGGTGLGLSISRKIIEGHSGKIFAENGEKGARLKFILPRG